MQKMSISSRAKSGAQSARRGTSARQEKVPRPAKRESHVIPIFILTIIAGYAVFLLISAQVEIQEKRNEYEQVTSRLTEVRAANEELERYLSNEEFLVEYMERIARGKLSYAHPRERIYFIMPSS